MKRIVLIFLLLGTSLKAQINSSINHDGLTRTFVYYVPTSWNSSTNLPLVILLHGLTQTGNGVMDITNFNALAEQHNFIVAYPDGINYAWNANMNVSVSSANDIGFIETLATYFQTTFNTNSAKQYLVGFSNGGFMSHKIACESTMCFAAIATVSGNMSDTTYANCNPHFNPAVLNIHGTADAIVDYNGSSTTGVSALQTLEKWSSFLSCDPNPITSPMSNPNFFDFSSPTLLTYQNCVSELKHIRVDGGGHQWPGIQTLVGGAGIINMDFYSPQTIWDFLNGKSCNITVSINELAPQSSEKEIARITDLTGRIINPNQEGIQLIHYVDGSCEKRYK